MQKGSTQKSFLKNPYLQYIIFGIIISLLPVLVNAGILKTSWVGIIGGTIIYAIAALGLNLLLGYSGLISLGTAGFMGLGAYISAYLTGDLGLPWEVGILQQLSYRLFSDYLLVWHRFEWKDFIWAL